MTESTAVLRRPGLKSDRNWPMRIGLLVLVLALEWLYVPINRSLSGGVALKTPLDVQSQTDLTNVVTNALAGSATAKLDYLERWDAVNIAAESGLLTNEATYRSELGIA